jgi:hypothetical protein
VDTLNALLQEVARPPELAFKLDPGNEIAQRAVIAVRERAEESPGHAVEQAELSAVVVLSTGMTLTQAQVVKWPFKGINRPAGEALDDGIITLRDLGWAIEEAQDTRIRDAAKTILLTRLVGAEPEEPPLPLKAVVASRFSESQERRNLVYFAALRGLWSKPLAQNGKTSILRVTSNDLATSGAGMIVGR